MMKLKYSDASRMCATALWSALVSGAMVLITVAASPAMLCAQENPLGTSKASSKEQAELVDGLLDLLGEPSSETTAAESQKAAGQAGSGNAPVGEDGSAAAVGSPASVSLSGNPLSMVHSSMRSAAEQLGRGVVGPKTQKLQGSILLQLDELIEQIQQQDPEQSSPQPKQSSSAAQSEAARMPSDEQSPSTGQAPPKNSQADGERQPNSGNADSGQGAQDRPSQAGNTADVAVDLTDPQRLQQDVWGQLPEQMRKQMQSRMVESFLPSYRPQIEAYFRKLLESQSQ